MISSKRIAIAAGVLSSFLATAAFLSVASDGTQSSTSAVNPNRFEGKFLLVNNPSELTSRGAWLQNVHVESIVGESFLVGTCVAISPAWKAYDGKLVFVSISHIESVIVCDSIDDLKKLSGDEEGS